eukprot:gene20989-25183_t
MISVCASAGLKGWVSLASEGRRTGKGSAFDCARTGISKINPVFSAEKRARSGSTGLQTYPLDMNPAEDDDAVAVAQDRQIAPAEGCCELSNLREAAQSVLAQREDERREAAQRLVCLQPGSGGREQRSECDIKRSSWVDVAAAIAELQHVEQRHNERVQATVDDLHPSTGSSSKAGEEEVTGTWMRLCEAELELQRRRQALIAAAAGQAVPFNNPETVNAELLRQKEDMTMIIGQYQEQEALLISALDDLEETKNDLLAALEGKASGGEAELESVRLRQEVEELRGELKLMQRTVAIKDDAISTLEGQVDLTRERAEDAGLAVRSLQAELRTARSEVEDRRLRSAIKSLPSLARGADAELSSRADSRGAELQLSPTLWQKLTNAKEEQLQQLRAEFDLLRQELDKVK